MTYLYNMLDPINLDSQSPLVVKIVLIIFLIILAVLVVVGYDNDPIDEEKH